MKTILHWFAFHDYYPITVWGWTFSRRCRICNKVQVYNQIKQKWQAHIIGIVEGW